MIGQGNSDQAVNALHLPGETPDGGVTCVVSLQLRRSHVVFDQYGGFIDQFVFLRHPSQELTRELCALLVVARRADLGSGRITLLEDTGVGFPEVVPQNGKAYHQIFASVSGALLRKGVESVQSVNPNIALRMKLGILGAAPKSFEFGKEGQAAARLEKAQTERRGVSAHQKFSPFFKEAFGSDAFQ